MGEKPVVPENSTRLMPGTVSFLREAPDSTECLLRAEPRAEPTCLCFLILPTLRGRWCHPHFTDEETQAPRGLVTCLMFRVLQLVRVEARI